MKTSTAIWLGIGGVVLVGGVIYFVTRPKGGKGDKGGEQQPPAQPTTTPTTTQVPEPFKIIKQEGTMPAGVGVLANFIAQFRQYEVVNKEGANVRKKPDVKSDIVKKLNKGDKFLGLDQNNNWILLGKEQYVSKSLVKMLPIPPKTSGVAAVK